MACVPNKKDIKQAGDFELFAQNRGLNYKWFESIEEAENLVISESISNYILNFYTNIAI